MDEYAEVVELEQAVEQVARALAIDIAKASAMVCTRLPSEKNPDRRIAPRRKSANPSWACAEIMPEFESARKARKAVSASYDDATIGMHVRAALQVCCGECEGPATADIPAPDGRRSDGPIGRGRSAGEHEGGRGDRRRHHDHRSEQQPPAARFSLLSRGRFDRFGSRFGRSLRKAAEAGAVVLLVRRLRAKHAPGARIGACRGALGSLVAPGGCRRVRGKD